MMQTVAMDVPVDQKPRENVSMGKRIGWGGTGVLLSLYTISGLQLFLAHQYSAEFRSFSRWQVFVFFGFAASYFVVATYLWSQWRPLSAAVERQRSFRVMVTSTSESHARSTKQTVIHHAFRVRDLLKMRGEWYLWKFYIVEITGLVVQIINLRSIYLCTLPAWVCATVCALFAAESVFGAFALTRSLTIGLRNQLVIVDICMDVLDTLLPLVGIFAYGVYIPVMDLFQIVIWPSLVTISKLRSIYVEILRKRGIKKGHAHEDDIVQAQKESIPPPIRRAIFYFMVLYAAGMIMCGVWVIVAEQVLGMNDCRRFNAGERIWDSCEIKSPLCNHFFRPNCNCAVITMRGHNLTTLPGVLSAMSALRKVEITNGPLAKLDDHFGKNAKKLSVLIFDRNRLTALPASVGSMNSLNTLYCMFNRIHTIPKQFWQLPELFALDFTSNEIGKTFEFADIKLPSLRFLILTNNTFATFPSSFSGARDRLPSLVVLFASGNKVTSLPTTIGSFSDLEELYIARNALNSSTAFPGEMQRLGKLYRLDARDNMLSSLPPFLVNMNTLMSSKGEIYISGNPLCRTNWADSSSCPRQLRNVLAKPSAGCTAQCASDCVTHWSENDRCDPPCNIIPCNYDNGQCEFR